VSSSSLSRKLSKSPRKLIRLIYSEWYTDIQAPSQDIFIHCFLLSSDKQTFMDYVMRRRSTCRRRIRNIVVTVTVTV